MSKNTKQFPEIFTSFQKLKIISRNFTSFRKSGKNSRSFQKLKKKDLITELVIRQEQVKEILEGKVTVKPKGKRTKKKKSDDENNKLLLDITKKQKQILKLNADKDGAKISSLRKDISKLTSKLSF